MGDGAETAPFQQAIEECAGAGSSSADRSRLRGGRASRIPRLDPAADAARQGSSSPVIGAVAPDTVTFELTEHVLQAVKAFERYDLVSAPVMDDRGKLVGRLTVDTVMDLARTRLICAR